MPVFENPADAQATASGRDEEYLLTESEAQIATALALMTGFSQGCCALHRAPMAGRVSEQLAHMARAADVSSDMRDFLLRLCHRWERVAKAVEIEAEAAQRHDYSQPSMHWHNSPETLQ